MPRSAATGTRSFRKKITEYENALGKKLSKGDAEAEIFADAIADQYFSDYDSMLKLATQDQGLFTKLKQWFYRSFIGRGTNIKTFNSQSTAAHKTYALMLRAEKAALNGVQSGEGVSHSPKKGIDKNLSRANNIGDLRNQFHGALSSSEWRTFYSRIADIGALVSGVGDVFYTEIGNKLIVAERQYTETKDAHDFIVMDVYSSDVNESYLWNEVLERIGGKDYDSKRIQREFVGFAEQYGESGLLRRYDSASGSYAEMYAEEARYGDFGSEVPPDNRVFSDRKGSVLENEPSGLRNNGVSNIHRQSINQTQSQQFKNWFGDWQNAPQTASKIVNADGTPKVMYHGTPAQFTAFDKKKAKSSGFYGRGFYFTDSESHSNQYGNSMTVYLNVKNPLAPGENSISKQQLRNFLEAVAENEDDYDIRNYGTENIDEIVNRIYKDDAFAVIQDVNATAEERTAAQSEYIKAEYEAEGYEGITGDRTEAYTSGNGDLRRCDR